MDKEKCPSCGAPLEPGAKFCWRCGTRLELLLLPSKERKGAEGLEERLDKIENLVEELHSKINEIVKTQSSHVKEEIKESPEKHIRTKTCPKCGAINNAKNTYCLECGTRLPT
jgi:uncharacterized OB-fold protein